MQLKLNFQTFISFLLSVWPPLQSPAPAGNIALITWICVVGPGSGTGERGGDKLVCPLKRKGSGRWGQMRQASVVTGISARPAPETRSRIIRSCGLGLKSSLPRFIYQMRGRFRGVGWARDSSVIEGSSLPVTLPSEVNYPFVEHLSHFDHLVRCSWLSWVFLRIVQGNKNVRLFNFWCLWIFFSYIRQIWGRRLQNECILFAQLTTKWQIIWHLYYYSFTFKAWFSRTLWEQEECHLPHLGECSGSMEALPNFRLEAWLISSSQAWGVWDVHTPRRQEEASWERQHSRSLLTTFLERQQNGKWSLCMTLLCHVPKQQLNQFINNFK